MNQGQMQIVGILPFLTSVCLAAQPVAIHPPALLAYATNFDSALMATQLVSLLMMAANRLLQPAPVLIAFALLLLSVAHHWRQVFGMRGVLVLDEPVLHRLAQAEYRSISRALALTLLLLGIVCLPSAFGYLMIVLVGFFMNLNGLNPDILMARTPPLIDQL